MANKVFIATSLDGYIADTSESGVEWLSAFPASENAPDTFGDFMQSIDALVMGRNTFETVVSFGLEAWVYTKPVYVLSNTLTKVPSGYEEKAFIVKGSVEEVVEKLEKKGHKDLYIDGGKTIQAFLEKNLIDEMSISIVPILLGKGVKLFGALEKPIKFEFKHSQNLYSGIIMNTYTRANS